MDRAQVVQRAAQSAAGSLQGGHMDAGKFAAYQRAVHDASAHVDAMAALINPVQLDQVLLKVGAAVEEAFPTTKYAIDPRRLLLLVAGRATRIDVERVLSLKGKHASPFTLAASPTQLFQLLEIAWGFAGSSQATALRLLREELDQLGGTAQADTLVDALLGAVIARVNAVPVGTLHGLEGWLRVSRLVPSMVISEGVDQADVPVVSLLQRLKQLQGTAMLVAPLLEPLQRELEQLREAAAADTATVAGLAKRLAALEKRVESTGKGKGKRQQNLPGLTALKKEAVRRELANEGVGVVAEWGRYTHLSGCR